MNDTKWHEVFTMLAARGPVGLAIRMKYLGHERIWVEHFLRPVNRHYTDAYNGPFEHREVEWLEVTGDQATAVQRELSGIGRLPIVTCEGGFRIHAYGAT
jgi:hypothetical protein